MRAANLCGAGLTEEWPLGWLSCLAGAQEKNQEGQEMTGQFHRCPKSCVESQHHLIDLAPTFHKPYTNKVQ